MKRVLISDDLSAEGIEVFQKTPVTELEM